MWSSPRDSGEILWYDSCCVVTGGEIGEKNARTETARAETRGERITKTTKKTKPSACFTAVARRTFCFLLLPTMDTPSLARMASASASHSSVSRLW